MKILVCIVSAFFVWSLSLRAQDDKEASPLQHEYEHIPMSAGLFLGARAGVNANDAPMGIQNGIKINGAPEFGGLFYMPLSKTEDLGCLLELAYSSSIFTLKGYTSGATFNNKYEYITFSPQLFVKGFLLGFSFGVPLGGECGESNVSASNMNTYVAFKIGGEIPIFEDETGRLNIFISGEYSLTKTIANFSNNIKNYEVYKETQAYEDAQNIYIKDEFKTAIPQDLSPRPASITIGFNYFFNFKQHPSK